MKVMGNRNLHQDKITQVGENLKKIRLSKGLSLRRLATLCNIDHSDIGKIEQGLVNITVRTLFELAEGLEVNAAELICFDRD